MGVYTKSDLIYLNVTEGKLRQKVGEQLGRPQYHEFDGFAGVITGVRLRTSQFNQNAPTVKLQLRMVDPLEGQQEYVLSITLLNSNGTVTVGGRMLVTRLVNPGNTGPGERINISVWAIEGTKATCCAPKSGSTGEIMPAIEHDKDDPQLPAKVAQMVEKLIEMYGPFEKDGSDHSYDQHDDHFEEDVPASALAAQTVQAATPNPVEHLYGEPKKQGVSAQIDDVPPPGDSDVRL